jgi:hypothetical protein
MCLRVPVGDGASECRLVFVASRPELVRSLLTRPLIVVGARLRAHSCTCRVSRTTHAVACTSGVYGRTPSFRLSTYTEQGRQRLLHQLRIDSRRKCVRIPVTSCMTRPFVVFARCCINTVILADCRCARLNNDVLADGTIHRQFARMVAANWLQVIDSGRAVRGESYFCSPSISASSV